MQTPLDDLSEFATHLKLPNLVILINFLSSSIFPAKRMSCKRKISARVLKIEQIFCWNLFRLGSICEKVEMLREFKFCDIILRFPNFERLKLSYIANNDEKGGGRGVKWWGRSNEVFFSRSCWKKKAT